MKNKYLQVDPIKLRAYIDDIGYKESFILKELRHETANLGDLAIMQIGAAQGVLIEMLCSVGNFKNCIEIGVFTGYSSICIAKGMSSDGKLYALDTSIEYTEIAKKYWKKANLDKNIELIINDANLTLDKFLGDGLADTFDFIFIDADKKNYLDYYEKSLKLLRTGGLILIDNTIWKGKVIDKEDNTLSTQSIRALNQFISTDDRVKHSLIAIYDGMTLCMKKSIK